jgi:hypothetical protein
MHEEAQVAQRSRGNDADISSSSRGKKQSKAWDDFDITEDTGKAVKAKCKHCQQVVECRTDKWTSVLHNHVKSEGYKKKLGATDQTPNPSRYIFLYIAVCFPPDPKLLIFVHLFLVLKFFCMYLIYAPLLF